MCWTGEASSAVQMRCEHGLALPAFVGEHAHLDELVREQVDVDLVQHGRCQALVANADDRVQVMRLGAQFAPL